MRKLIEEQIHLGQIPIDEIKIDLKSRDEIPKVLFGLQNIYLDKEVREEVFEVLNDLIPEQIDKHNGRPGMCLWDILVLGTVRLACSWDFDKLREISNEHKTLRLMLGLGSMDCKKYALQTLKDNISLFTPEILNKINQIVVKHGQKIVGKNEPNQPLRGSCDSFPLKINVHFPTDINILFDAIRAILMMILLLRKTTYLPGWRKCKNYIKKAKKLHRNIVRLKLSKSKEKEPLLKKAYEDYLEFANSILDKVSATIDSINSSDDFFQNKINWIMECMVHAERQLDQIRRRIFNGEKIPHSEKVFSIFQQHTEWIVKGKMGTPVELGLNVCIVKDQFGFILHHKVMQNQSDVDIAVPIIFETKQLFENFNSCSFDKGFHSPSNQKELADILDTVILPRKGKLSPINKEIENSPEFKEARRKHSAVESSINGLEHSGLDICRDHGIDGFKRYVALAVLARNIQTLGHAIQQKKYLELNKKHQKCRLAA